jgi:hypothetical protein
MQKFRAVRAPDPLAAINSWQIPFSNSRNQSSGAEFIVLETGIVLKAKKAKPAGVHSIFRSKGFLAHIYNWPHLGDFESNSGLNHFGSLHTG